MTRQDQIAEALTAVPVRLHSRHLTVSSAMKLAQRLHDLGLIPEPTTEEHP